MTTDWAALGYVVAWSTLFGLWVVTCARQAGGYRGLMSGQWWMLQGGDGTHRIRYLLEGLSTGEVYEVATRVPVWSLDLAFGVEEEHSDLTGKSCGSYVAWRTWSYMPATGHALVALSPLTIDGSLACPKCPSHGFIHDGRWRDA